MLQPREADIPALFLVLVVLPLVAYFLLGIWNEAVKRKARMSMLAQIAAEEACRVEEMSSADVMPIMSSSRTGFQECARCFAPATTRCSRCKSVRYCSGKCQIIHWRQGHKQECHNWQERANNRSGQQSFVDNSKSPSHCSESSLHNDFPGEFSDDSSLGMTDASQDSEIGVKQLDRRTINKIKRTKLKVDPTVFGVDESSRHVGDGDVYLSSETASRDSLDHKSGTGNFNSHDVFYRDQHNGCSSAAKNVMPRSYKVAGSTIDDVKQSCSASTANLFHLNKHAINESETDMNLTSENSHEAGFSSSEILDSSYPSQSNSAKGGTMYKKPPYILGQPTSLQQSLAENNFREYSSQGTDRKAYKENGPKSVQKNNSPNSIAQKSCLDQNEGKTSGSKKSSKVTKRNLVGLINDNKRTKICRLLFPYDDLVKFFHCEIWGISPRGLMNCGNSCYANAVLQCLTSTKPLLVYLLRRSHSRTCLVRDWCLLCELEHHVSLLQEDGGPLSPSGILSNMRNIGCRLGGGDQEDAHEFLRLLVMSMQSICLEGLGGEKAVDPRLQETTLIQQIFGGRLQSKVKCLRCLLESERYENIMDLTLEIHGWVESLEDALTQFTSPEDLDGENMYRCGRCCAYVKARKQLTLHEVPNILTIVLKRFQSGKYGKINKCVTFPEMLDMIPFVTGTADKPPLYILYAVIVHLDNFNASFSGHYISYVKDLQGTWFRIDDLEVQAVQSSQVMSEGAYMLFYSRSSPRPPRTYVETTGIQDPVIAKQTTSKMQKPPRHDRHKQTEVLFGSGNSVHLRNYFKPDFEESVIDPTAKNSLKSSGRLAPPTQGRSSDSVSREFSDATTSSDWSLFTSSDESSFTTESTRDSFSTVDYGDNASFDALSSIFNPYIPEYSQDNTVSCKKVSPCRPQTRFFSESMGCVVDPPVPTQSLGNVHRGRNL